MERPRRRHSLANSIYTAVLPLPVTPNSRCDAGFPASRSARNEASAASCASESAKRASDAGGNRLQPVSSSAQPASRHCRPIKPFLSKDSSAGATPCPICRNTSRRETAPCSNRNSRSSIWRVAVGLTAHGGSQRSTHSSLAAASSRGPEQLRPSRIHASPSAAKTSTGSLGKSFSSRICALPCASIVRRRICVTRSPRGAPSRGSAPASRPGAKQAGAPFPCARTAAKVPFPEAKAWAEPLPPPAEGNHRRGRPQYATSLFPAARRPSSRGTTKTRQATRERHRSKEANGGVSKATVRSKGIS